jgi:hypothetical protein
LSDPAAIEYEGSTMSQDDEFSLQKNENRSLSEKLPTDVDTGRKFLQVGKSNLFVSERGAEEVGKIDLIERNTQRVDIVDGRNDYERVKSHLNWAYTFQLFNLFIYYNDATQSFSAYIHDARDLHSVFTHIEKDIDAGHDFFKYSVQNVFNLKRSRRMKSSL